MSSSSNEWHQPLIAVYALRLSAKLRTASKGDCGLGVLTRGPEVDKFFASSSCQRAEKCGQATLPRTVRRSLQVP
ncbi:hypothetical protein ABBQ38_005468 [Trebouxia sp. C0009 RCD-2024]